MRVILPGLRSDGNGVVVARFGTLAEAHLARGVLENAGISCTLGNEHFVGVAPHLANAVGGVELRVAERDLADAQSLLETEASTSADPDPDPVEPDAREAESDRDRQAVRALRAAVIGLFVPVILNAYSLFLLATLGQAPGPLSRRGRRQVGYALALDGLLLLVPLAVLLGRR